MSRRIAGALLAILASGCASVPSDQAADPAPAPSPAPVAPPAAAPLTGVRGDFTLSGEPTQGGYLRGTAPSNTVRLALDGEPVAARDDGTFLVAFDRDAPATARLAATLADGREIVRSLTIAPRAWQIERVNVARTPGGASADFMARRQPELERIAAARARTTDAEGWRQRFTWPARGRLSGLFGSQRIYRGGEPGAYHSGLDIAGGADAPYTAPADGVVVLAADTPFSLEGHLLIIDHGNGLSSAFLHSARLHVREGERVRQGQHIGDIGMTGRATGPHLHWGMVWRGRRLDPLLFTGPQT